MHRTKRQTGSVIVFVAILIPVLLAGLGLVIDNGQAYDMKRRLQKAADAGALAAAHEIRRGNTSAITKVAMENAARNGSPAGGADIQVYNPPKTGKRAGQSDFVEVVVRREAPLYFMKPFYDGQLMVEARAIGGVMPTRTCMYVLNQKASGALLISGTTYVDVSQCGVQVNSSASNAAQSNGGAVMKAARIDVVGKYSGVGYTPTPRTQAPYVADPLASLEAPPTTGACAANKLVVKNARTIDPGIYCGGIEINAGGVLTLRKGIYVLKGGLTVRGGGTIKGDEVMIYNTQSPYGPIDFGGGATAQLTAPKDGVYESILFFTDRAVSGGKSNHFTGGTDSWFTGTLYFPTTALSFAGNTELENQEILMIADTIEFQGNSKITAPTTANWLTREAALVY
jgi:hypothetical protein